MVLKITALNDLLKLRVTITIAKLTDIFKMKLPLLGCKGRLLRPVLALLLMDVPVERLEMRGFFEDWFPGKADI